MSKKDEEPKNSAAAMAYRPIGLLGSVLGGLAAGALFKQIWKLVDREDDAPDALQSEYSWSKLLLAAALEGAIFATVKAAVDRAGALGFQRWTGEWPGD
jgi:Protein of unknown function (DUF4235)